MAVRELLHITKLTRFKKWLRKQGWTIQRPKGPFEVLQATKPGKDTLIIWTRMDAIEHYSIQDKYAYLVRQFIRDENGEKKETYTVRIEQTLEGFVEIEAASEDEALNIANYLYVGQGRELPQMDDCCDPLRFQIHR